VHFDIADLKLFIQIAEMENLTRGAGRAALSPAAASARLKSLEQQLGSRLFYRDSRGLTLTSAGATLLRHARAILQQIDYLRSDFSDHSAGHAGHLRIYANTTAVTEVLPEVLAQFMGERPNVTVDLQERNTKKIVRGNLDSAADFGIVAGPVPTEGLQSICFSTDHLVLVTPIDHPLNSHAAVAFEETLDFPHIGLQESTLHSFLLHTVSKLDRTLNVRVLMSGFEAMCRMVEAGVGIGLVPESAARRHARSMKLNIIALTNEWMHRERKVLFRDLEALPGSARAFLDVLMKRYEASGGQFEDS